MMGTFFALNFQIIANPKICFRLDQTVELRLFSFQRKIEKLAFSESFAVFSKENTLAIYMKNMHYLCTSSILETELDKSKSGRAKWEEPSVWDG